jgi:hypothetical protein
MRQCRGTSLPILRALALEVRKNERRCRGTSPPGVWVGCACVLAKLVAAVEQPTMWEEEEATKR